MFAWKIYVYSFFKSNDCFLFWCLSLSLHLLTYIISFSLFLYYHFYEGSNAYFEKTKTAKKIWLGDTELLYISWEKFLNKFFFVASHEKYAHWWAISYKIDNKILKSYFLLWTTWDISLHLLSIISEKICWELKKLI